MPLGPLSQPGASARVPTVPTSVSATAVSGGQATVSFVASTNPGKGGNYVVTSSPSSFTANGASSPIAVTGLVAGTAYTFTVVKQSGSGISSATSNASGSITAFNPPTFGTQTGSSTATAPGASTTGISNVYTTTGTLSHSLGINAAFYDYSRISGTAVTPVGNALTGLAENTSHEWRVRTTNTSSTFALTTRVTPNGSTTTVSVEYGTSESYGSSAGSVNIGAGISEVTSSWDLGSSTATPIYWRATATYAGGASVQTSGTISRAVDIYNGTTTGSFATYTTRTRTNLGQHTVTKPSYGANITISSYTLVGGGGGGGNFAGSFLGYGGGGGGNTQTGSDVSTTSFTISVAGAGGNKEVAGNSTTLSGASFTTITAAGGNPASGNFQGGSSGNGNAGFAGGGISGGGGGGVSGAANSIDGGSGNGSGVSPGGPGFFDTGFGSGYGNYVSGAEGNYGAGGKANTAGANGYTDITWIGPA